MTRPVFTYHPTTRELREEGRLLCFPQTEADACAVAEDNLAELHFAETGAKVHLNIRKPKGQQWEVFVDGKYHATAADSVHAAQMKLRIQNRLGVPTTTPRTVGGYERRRRVQEAW